MKLEQKFEAVEPYHVNYLEGLVEVSDEFAIDFAEWISETTTTLGGGLWMTRNTKIFVHKNQLLEIYKTEKGL